MQTRLSRFRLGLAFSLLFVLGIAFGSGVENDKFRQLEEILPTPNSYRTASGAPGHEYWQQRANYDIDVTLDDANQRIIGAETITYTNNSPDTLAYLWVQLDPNLFSPESHSVLTSTAPNLESASYRSIQRMIERGEFDGSVEISSVLDARGNGLAHTIVGTMMRVDLESPLESGATTAVSIAWNYSINNAKQVGGRTGYEHFEDDDNNIYEIAQWFPRMAAYTDVNGWQHKQFLGAGEFTLEFGDYVVRITAPSDHVVAASGELLNSDQVLTPVQQERLRAAKTATAPVFIVTPEEAKANEQSRATDTKTWIFKADNVRDFAFATSRKFIWDALRHQVEDGRPVWAMSYYPNEGEPLWSKYSTHSIVHTLNVYSRMAFPYPYPVAISVNGPVGGMEYPMICFNGPRPEKDGTYSARTKYGLISVIIHEVGHNWFPMIVNSDERQWTWMDEGLNTFLQYIAEQEWEDEYPSRRGEPKNIVGFMKSDYQVPIMTNSESLLQFGSNAYAKPATALNILRETIMGRELFDFAFKQFSERWAFKRPQPADFFRSMEDASAIDLDWFWRGWFYTTDHTDISIAGVKHYTIDTRDPDIEKPKQREKRDAEPLTQAAARYKQQSKYIEAFPELADFYNSFDELDVLPADREKFEKLADKLEPEERALLAADWNFYVVEFENVGGLVMPIILQVDYEDGTSEELRVPAEVWRKNTAKVSKLVMSEKTIAKLVLDPKLETADVDLSNNHYPRLTPSKRIELRSWKGWGGGDNPMRRARKAAEKDAKEATANEDEKTDATEAAGPKQD